MTIAATPLTTQVPRRRVIAINGSAGAQVTISCSGPCRYMEIQECPPNAGTFNGTNYAPQGLNYTRADEAYANTYGLNPGAILQFGDQSWMRDRLIGIPANMTDPAGVAIAQSEQSTIKAISATVTASYVEVREWM